jgi:hypothetical protein
VLAYLAVENQLNQKINNKRKKIIELLKLLRTLLKWQKVGIKNLRLWISL